MKLTKLFFTGIFLILSATAAQAAELSLACEGDNLIYAVNGIDVAGNKIRVSYSNERGEAMVDAGTSAGRWFQTSFGVQVTIPEALLSGKARSGEVSLSTYDYPYETVSCSVK